MTRNKVESEFQPMPIDFWNHLYNPITGLPFSIRDKLYSSKKYYKTYDVLTE